MNFSVPYAFSFLFEQRLWFFKFFMALLLLVFPTAGLALVAYVKPNSYLLTYFQTFFTSFDSVIVPTFVVFAVSFLTIAFGLALFGYVAQMMNNQIYDEPQIMPGWFGYFCKYTWIGFKMVFGLWIWGLSIVSLLGASFLAYTLKKFYPEIVNMLYLSWLPNHPHFVNKGVAVVILIFAAYLIFMLPALLAAFAKSLRFMSLFNLIEAQRVINRGFGSYFFAYLTIFVLKTIVILLMVLFQMSVTTVILSPVLFLYFLFASTNIIAQLNIEPEAEVIAEPLPEPTPSPALPSPNLAPRQILRPAQTSTQRPKQNPAPRTTLLKAPRPTQPRPNPRPRPE